MMVVRRGEGGGSEQECCWRRRPVTFSNSHVKCRIKHYLGLFRRFYLMLLMMFVQERQDMPKIT